ncbi:hypothetical protein C451_20792 [Halococcus thailandensis JCM 13552]|uniref:Uncharacterized protein n=2 Tax=Halococcus TaxID=2249 RepID=M0MUR6_9EURY|nr:hypothetical protein C451_20792 [Halococcus thailandensis JCM 13552]
MADHDHASYAEAIEYAADTTLIQEDEITVQELVQVVDERLDKMDETRLP